MTAAAQEEFTAAEREALAPFFTNLDGPVFALTNLPEVVKGALFARYSRSSKSLRRLFLDEFLDRVDPAAARHHAPGTGIGRASALYERVFDEYGDDSVAQLGGAHLACEGVSNILTKVLERGRLAAYLEQSTRYVPYTDRSGGRWRYLVPAELDASPLRPAYVAALDRAFETYARWLDPLEEHFARRFPRDPAVPEPAWRRAVRARALDVLRGLLPAATRSNVGIYASGQAYEALLLRMRAHPLHEVQWYAERMLAELRTVIPAFLTRVDRDDRGGAWSRYLAATRAATAEIAARLVGDEAAEPRPEVVLTDFDPDGETKVVAAALYAASHLPDDQLLDRVRRLDAATRAAILQACVGTRGNRRHRPGRAFERTAYRFDILTDYGAFRDLQRHRLLTVEWQPLSVRHGYTVPDAVAEAGAEAAWHDVMRECGAVAAALDAAGLPDVAAYAVPMAYRIRFCVQMNAREAMHVLELRTAPQGHPSYRRVCQEMHRLIAEVAGHRAIAAAMQFVDHTPAESGRLAAEERLEQRRARGG